jgi:arsenite-transporting ATPase
MLIARADAEKQWLEKVKQISSDNFVAIPWFQDASIENIVNFSGGSKSDE